MGRIRYGTEQRVFSETILNMSLLKNVAENFDAHSLENHFQVNKAYTSWSIS
jgi:hypothetical protein